MDVVLNVVSGFGVLILSQNKFYYTSVNKMSGNVYLRITRINKLSIDRIL